MHVTLFNLYEDLNTVLQCPIQIVECEYSYNGDLGMLNQAVLEALYRAVSDISQSSMASIPVIREV